MEHFYDIGDHTVCIFQETGAKDFNALLPSFDSFVCDSPKQEPLFTLTIDGHLRPYEDGQLIRDFDTGNGYTTVTRMDDGGYQYIVRNIYGQPCCLLITNEDFSQCSCRLRGNTMMQTFGLNNALMLVYSFRGLAFQTLLMHASAIAYNGKAFPFYAQSGTGKSTHTSLWMKYIDGTQLLNDDNPIVRVMNDGKVRLYGSPWSGKTPCYRSVWLPLGALIRIERSERNHLDRQSVIEAFASLLPAFSSMKWDEKLNDMLCTTVSDIIAAVPTFSMFCRPDEEAARKCYETLSKL